MERRQEVGNFTLGNTDSIRQHILQLLETDILSCGGRSLTSFGIFLLNADEIRQQSSNFVSRELNSIDIDLERQNSGRRISQLNEEQRRAFDVIEGMCSGNYHTTTLF